MDEEFIIGLHMRIRELIKQWREEADYFKEEWEKYNPEYFADKITRFQEKEKCIRRKADELEELLK